MSAVVTEAPPAPADERIEVSASKTIPMTAEHRCKRSTRGHAGESTQCGAEAYVEVTYPGDVSAFYCAHHANQAWASILANAVKIKDERSFLYAGPLVSSY